MVDETEKKTKRNVAVRRGHQVTTADEGPLLPLTSSSSQNERDHHPSSPPPSGNNNRTTTAFLIPSVLKFSVRDRKDATAKRRFRVEVPTRMLNYVVLVFFVLPLFLFLYREMHLHNESDAHFKAEHYIHVDTQDVLSHLLDKPANSTTVRSSTHVSLGTKEASRSKSLKSPLSKSKVVEAGEADDVIPLEDVREEEPEVVHKNATVTTLDASSSPDPPEKEAESKETSVTSKERYVTHASKENSGARRRKRRRQ